MKKYLYVGIGGFFGAVSRVIVKNIDTGFKTSIPFNTLLINIIGSFLIALILSAVLYGLKIREEIKLLCTTGFLGGFTTFSTLCRESVVLINNGEMLSAVIYILSSTLLGLFGVYIGFKLSGKVFSRFIEDEDELEKAN